MAAPRPIITCHVLDTVHGKPAADIAVTLHCRGASKRLDQDKYQWRGKTNADGRVTEWSTVDDKADGNSQLSPHELMEECLKSGQETGERSVPWELTFYAHEYFGEGVETFWDDIVIHFKTSLEPVGGEQRKHWHIPLLLSPWSYTTYRGS